MNVERALGGASPVAARKGRGYLRPAIRNLLFALSRRFRARRLDSPTRLF